MRRVIVTVRGRVQGVGYRYFAIEQAERLGLVGYARNLPDGGVEVVAEGEQAELEAFVDALRRGPSSAFVREARADWMPATGEFKWFDVRR